LKSRVPTGEIWSKAPSNPLSSSNKDLVLTRVLWLEGAEEKNLNTIDRYIYIHGTNQPDLLGQPASHGCIRVSNEDALELYALLREGSEVEVI
jgi:lipoprotein-anchoring transpeptidase ErfK/SrfK